MIPASFHGSFQEGRVTQCLALSLLGRFVNQAFRKAEAGKKASGAAGSLCCERRLQRAEQRYISLRTLSPQEGVNQHWFPIGIWQLWRPESCGEEQARIPLEKSLLSVGTDAVPGTTLCSGTYAIRARDYQKVGLDRLPPHQAVDFPILVLKCDERCHRRP